MGLARGGSQIGIPYVSSDGGRSLSRYKSRRRQRSDCAVRALAIVAGTTYDQAYGIAIRASPAYSPSEGWVIERWLALGGYLKAGKPSKARPWLPLRLRFRVQSFGMIVGATSRLNLEGFAMGHPKGRFIVGTAGHVLALVDGVAFDTPEDILGYRDTVYCALEAIVVPEGDALWHVRGSRWVNLGGKRKRLTRPLGVVNAPNSAAEGEDPCEKRAYEVAALEWDHRLRRGEDLLLVPLDVGGLRY